MRAILTYHSLDDSGSVISVPPAVFAEHVRFFAEGTVRVVALEELLALPPEVEAVALTFDDALESVARVAAPLLERHRLGATCFVPTTHVGGTNRWDSASGDGVPTFRVLGWDDLSALQKSGIALGSHARRHRALTGLSRNELDDELGGSRDELQRRTGARPACFAYPYGAVDAAAAAAVKAAYRVGCTTVHRPLPEVPAPEVLPRLDAFYFRAPGAISSWGTKGFWRKARLRQALRAARRAFS